MRVILGLSAYYHDSAATLLVDGVVVAAAQEERFSRRKNDERFPINAVKFCLSHGGQSLSDLDAVVFYDKPIVKFSRMLEGFLAIAPAGLLAWLRVIPGWLSEKLNLRQAIRDELDGLPKSCPILFTEHHVSHAASAFYPSPYDHAAILTVDGVGEWATTTISRGSGSRIEMLSEVRFPHSLGLLYSAFTSYCGFRVNSGEYKLMGLAPYGKPVYADLILKNLIDLKHDGSFALNMDYFSFLTGSRMTNDRFNNLFGGLPRLPETPFDKRHMDIAASIQFVINEAVIRLAKRAKEITGETRLCLAGGVALNCVANGLLLRSGVFEEIWIQPAAGDAGGALGAALEAWNQSQSYKEGNQSASAPRSESTDDDMNGSLLGPEYNEEEIFKTLQNFNAVYLRFDEEELLDRVSALLENGEIVGWFQGRMEFGPRSLGNRSILGDPRLVSLQSSINRKVKFRESFRPFAPAVLEERSSEYFDLQGGSPYMLKVANVAESQLKKVLDKEDEGFDRIKYERSTIPAVTHVDGSARIQTVSKERNPLFWNLIKCFESKTNCGVLLNTSFNVRGEPVVCTPEDAYRCFVNTAIDWLAIGPFLLKRDDQPKAKPQQEFDPVPD
ncbi:MAG: carbamoyltransferase [Verrucomicrobiota bacterium]|nr:carbamoyltransferase [Verrucomicrobiota bacterium]